MNQRILFFVLLAASLNGQGQATQWIQLTPMAARAGATMTLRSCIRSSAVTRVALESTVAGRPTIAELQAQGGCYWEGSFTVPVAPLDDMFRPDFAFMRLYSGNTLMETINVFPDVFSSDLPLVPVTSLAADAQRTDYLVNLVAPAVFPADGSNLFVPSLETAARRFYEVMPDDFDQLNIVFGRGFIFNRFHVNVRQPVAGIGAAVSPQAAAAWGTSTRLLGVNVFPLPGAFDGAERAQSHEAAHQWINYIPSGIAGGTAHWPISSMAFGVMGYSLTDGSGGALNCSLRLEGGNLTVTGSGDPKLFNPLDLYLMGAIPASEVPDQYVVTDAGVIAGLRQSCIRGPIPPSQFTVLRIADLVAQLGPRVPDAAAAPKSLRIATVLVSDRLLNQEEMSFYSFYARRAEERGTLSTKTGFGRIPSNPMFVSSGGKFTLRTQLNDTRLPVIANGGVVSVAFTSDLVPGGIGSIFGTDLASGTAAAPFYPLPAVLAGTRVFVNGRIAPLYYVSPGQVNFQVPMDVVPSAGGVFAVRVESAAGASNIAFPSAKAVAPAVLFYGDRKTVAVDTGYQVITEEHPARHGQFVVVYFTGVGPTTPGVATGAAAPTATLARCVQNLQAEIGGVVVTPDFCGLAPGFGGLGQMNFTVPPGAGTGLLRFRIVGSGASNETFMSVQP